MNQTLTTIVFLCGMLFLGQAHADYNYGFPGTRNSNLQRVTITEYSPQGRAVVLQAPDELKSFLEHLGSWGINKRGMRTIDRDVFLNNFPLRYQVTVESSDQGASYTNTVFIAMMRRADPVVSFVCVAKNSDGDFTIQVEGPERSFSEPHTPFEEYMERIFPPLKTATTASTVIPPSKAEPSKRWSEATLTLSVWLLVAICFGVSCATYLVSKHKVFQRIKEPNKA